MSEKMQKLTKETLVPIGVVLTMIVAVVSLTWWVSAEWAMTRHQVSDHESRIVVLEQRVLPALDRIEQYMKEKK